MSRFRVVVVDDEPLARQVIRDLLARDREVEVVGEAGDGASGLELIRRSRADIALLDIEMPEMGGLEVAAALDPEERPVIVFVTAYSRFATGAFDVEALDYILKPFSDERFFGAVERAKARVRERRLSGLAERVASEAAALARPRAAEENEVSKHQESDYLKVIPVRRDGRSFLVKPKDVLWIESQDYCARLHAARDSYLVRASLAFFEKRLDPRRFVRVHRQAIVNADEVVAIEHLPKGRNVVVLSNDVRCRVSQARKSAVDKLLLPRLR